MKKIIAGWLLISSLISCTEEETGSSNQYLIINKIDQLGNVSLFDRKSGNFTERFYTRDEGVILNAQKKDDFLCVYATTKRGYELAKIDLNTQQEVRSVKVWPEETPIMDFFGKELVMINPSVYWFPQSTAYINIYDENLVLKDSVTLSPYEQVNAAKIVGSRLFLAMNNDLGYYLKVLDLGTLSVVDSVSFSKRCVQILEMGENLMLVEPLDLVIVNSTTLEIEQSIPAVYLTKGGVGMKNEENVIFCAVANAQPAMTLYSLYRIDLSTGEKKNLTPVPVNVAPPLFYDEREDVIVSGSGFKIFSVEGTLIHDLEAAPPNTTHIFVK